MRRVGRIDPDFSRPFDPVDALARSIMHQQLSGTAAAAITRRLEALMPRPGRISAAGIEGLDDATLRAAGASRQKVAALRDLAAKSGAGIVPSARRMAWMADDEIIERLVAVRGIGRWTVEMLLIFRLGRPDVLPVDDLGVRKGVQRVRGLAALPTPRELRDLGAVWSPWASLASLYLWRIAGFDADEPKPDPTPFAALTGKLRLAASTNAKARK